MSKSFPENVGELLPGCEPHIGWVLVCHDCVAHVLPSRDYSGEVVFYRNTLLFFLCSERKSVDEVLI